MKALMLLSAAAAVSAAGTLNAQANTAKPDSTCTKYSNGRVECRVYRGWIQSDSALPNVMFMRMDSSMAKRAALGVELRSTGTQRDTLGVFVEGVTPKGPAEAAGLVEGDRIAAINGVDLRTPASDVEDSYSNGLASHRLTREVRKLAPGARVTLRVYSGGKYRDVQIVAGRASDVMRLGDRFRTGFPGGTMTPFGGPEGAMMLAPDARMMRERIEPLIHDRIEPIVREQTDHLQKRIELRNPGRVKRSGPLAQTQFAMQSPL
ncbi:MAG: PDZ domain-containing protein [Gemmatimonadaceae bacterium]